MYISQEYKFLTYYYMKRLVFLSFVLTVLMSYEVFWHDKREYMEIANSDYVAFVEKIDHQKKIGLCDEFGGIFREAKYYDVKGYDGYVIAHNYDDGLVDVFTEDGDSILPEILKESCYYNDFDSIKYFIITNKDGLNYVLIADSRQIVGPYPDMSVLQERRLLLSHEGERLHLFTFDGAELSPSECEEAIFVEEISQRKLRKRVSTVTSNYFLARCDSCWLKVSTDGVVCDTVANEVVDMLKQSDGFNYIKEQNVAEVQILIQK